MPVLTIQKLHSILRKAGYKRSRYFPSGMVRGIGDRTPGYRLKEEKIANSDWYGRRVKGRDEWKFLSTETYTLSYYTNEPDNPMILDKLGDVLTQAGINWEWQGRDKIFIPKQNVTDSGKQRTKGKAE